MKNIIILLLISGLFSSCSENETKQKNDAEDLTDTDTIAVKKITKKNDAVDLIDADTIAVKKLTKEEKNAWSKSSKTSFYCDDTITWSDEKAIIFNKKGYTVIFEDVDLTYYEQDLEEYSLEEIKSFEDSEPERYEMMMNELTKRSCNYTLLEISGPYVTYKEDWNYNGGASYNGGVTLKCYSLISDSIIKTINVSAKADDEFKSHYEQAIIELNNFIEEITLNHEEMVQK